MIGNATPSMSTVVLTKLNDNVPVKPVITNTAAMIMMIAANKMPYFFFSLLFNGLVGFEPICPKFFY